ncbi:ABC transporter substrate-binding protein [Curtobacterium sp. MCBD17_028]|uniref:ABC transporter substrate-binding protein n=1 Tax=Curtobacterium sp. MCBD17_028 TaxID=2175670 RepID=UPI000DA8DF9B|nr:sugar ABC transporter substrate-binding protein [Curtobacterium sp. MCBD17_028]PZE27141.1 sugar ABC transporter substrate-binding protein [Curtobacterium sp. MCBD17_028]
MRSHVHPGRRRLLVTAAGVIAGALALTGCSSGGGAASSSGSWSIPSKDPKTTVKVLSILSLKSPDNMQPVVDAFEKAHPNITIKWQTVPFDSLNSTVDSHVSNKGGDPDLYWADQPRIAALASRGEAEDLTSQFGGYSSSFDKVSYETGVQKGKLYALPIANSTQLLYYNKDLLAKAGLPTPSASTSSRMTWQDLASDALKAKQAGAQYGMTFGQFDRYYQLEPLSVQLGGSVGADGKDNLTPDFTNSAWVKAMTWYRSIFASGAAPKGMTADQTDPAFLAGQVAYSVEGPWLLPELQTSKVHWGVAPMPAFADSKQVATPTGSWSVAMNPFSKQKDATAVFMKWLAIDNGSGYIRYRSNPELAANVKGKQLYFDKPVFQSTEGTDAAKIINHETSQTAVSRVKTIGYIEFESIINQAYSDIRNGADPKQALDAAKAKLTTAWAKYK